MALDTVSFPLLDLWMVLLASATGEPWSNARMGRYKPDSCHPAWSSKASDSLSFSLDAYIRVANYDPPNSLYRSCLINRDGEKLGKFAGSVDGFGGGVGALTSDANTSATISYAIRYGNSTSTPPASPRAPHPSLTSKPTI